MRHLLWRTSVVLAVIFLVFTAQVSLSESLSDPSTIPVAQDFPASPPDIANGAQLYAQHCTQCHGLTGIGNGELVQSGEIPYPGDFTTPDTAQKQRPQDWFNTITNGRLENMMPPWGDAFTAQERWDVAMYTYTLAYPTENISRGAEIWEAECSDCHGADGRGNGPQAADFPRGVGNLTNQSGMATLSDSNIYVIIDEGVGDEMPAYRDQYDAASLQAVTQYSRTLSLINAEQIGKQVEAQPLPTPTIAGAVYGTVRGAVTNGTSGGEVPDDLKLVLQYAPVGGEIQVQITDINADGTYQFNDVPFSNNYAYIVTTLYRDRVFNSRPITGNTEITDVELPLTIYELTDDPANISIHRVEIEIVPTQIEGMEDGLRVWQRITYSNSGDRAFTTDLNAGQGRYASLPVLVPPAALILTDDQDTRYAVMQDNYAVLDTAPVLPGDNHQITILYFLQYKDSAIVSQQWLNPMRGDIEIRIIPSTLVITNDALTLSEEPLIQDNRSYAVYTGTLDIARGEYLEYEISGDATVPVGVDAAPGVLTGETLIFIVLIVLIFIGGIAILYLLLRPRGAGSKDAQIDALIRKIAELDEMHDNGHINHDIYQRQRQDYKAQLAELMEE